MSHITLFTRVLVVIVGVWGFTAPASAKDDNNYGEYTDYGYSCAEYLDAYSRTTLVEENFQGPHEVWRAFGYIEGYISAYNAYIPNGKRDITSSHSFNDVRRWLASWCRDNDTKGVHEALLAFIKSRE